VLFFSLVFSLSKLCRSGEKNNFAAARWEVSGRPIELSLQAAQVSAVRENSKKTTTFQSKIRKTTIIRPNYKNSPVLR
jgi:hypothetical protein